jgi:hypothetical protein
VQKLQGLRDEVALRYKNKSKSNSTRRRNTISLPNAITCSRAAIMPHLATVELFWRKREQMNQCQMSRPCASASGAMDRTAHRFHFNRYYHSKSFRIATTIDCEYSEKSLRRLRITATLFELTSSTIGENVIPEGG